jgi:hypothetical protein
MRLFGVETPQTAICALRGRVSIPTTIHPYNSFRGPLNVGTKHCVNRCICICANAGLTTTSRRPNRTRSFTTLECSLAYPQTTHVSSAPSSSAHNLPGVLAASRPIYPSVRHSCCFSKNLQNTSSHQSLQQSSVSACSNVQRARGTEAKKAARPVRAVK